MEKWKLILQMFSDGGEPAGEPQGEPAGEPQGGAEPPAGEPQGGEAGKPEEKKPFATFPDEKAFMARIKREGAKQKEALLKSLGLDSEDSLKAIIEAERARKESELTEAEKLKKKLDQLQSERDTATQRAEKVARTTEAKLIANELGVNPSRINHFLKLADISDVKVDENGTVDSETLRTKLSDLLGEVPEFRAQKTPPAPQGAGADFGQGNKGGSLTLAKIKTMTAEEIAQNIDEVRKVMKTGK